MYVVRGNEVEQKYSPIERKLMEYSEKINKAPTLSLTMYKCTFCGQRERGITNIFDGTFKCRQCLLKEEGQRLENDPDMLKRERIWNIRRARERYKLKETLKLEEVK
jgi:hypothetical protein